MAPVARFYTLGSRGGIGLSFTTVERITIGPEEPSNPLWLWAREYRTALAERDAATTPGADWPSFPYGSSPYYYVRNRVDRIIEDLRDSLESLCRPRFQRCWISPVSGNGYTGIEDLLSEIGYEGWLSLDRPINALGPVLQQMEQAVVRLTRARVRQYGNALTPLDPQFLSLVTVEAGDADVYRPPSISYHPNLVQGVPADEFYSLQSRFAVGLEEARATEVHHTSFYNNWLFDGPPNSAFSAGFPVGYSLPALGGLLVIQPSLSIACNSVSAFKGRVVALHMPVRWDRTEIYAYGPPPGDDPLSTWGPITCSINGQSFLIPVGSWDWREEQGEAILDIPVDWPAGGTAPTFSFSMQIPGVFPWDYNDMFIRDGERYYTRSNTVMIGKVVLGRYIYTNEPRTVRSAYEMTLDVSGLLTYG